MKAWWRRVRPYVLSSLVFRIARGIGVTLRIEAIGWDAVKDLPIGRIYTGWHGRSYIPANFFEGRGVWCIISHSRDGEMQTRIFSSFGFQIIRGSTGRGGERALVESIRVLRKGDEMAITPDGPRGPAGVVQGGVLLMAKKTGAALVPVGSSAKRAWYAPTWDRYMVAKPFSKAVFVFGDPIYVPADADDAKIEEIRLALQKAIDDTQATADAHVGARPPANPSRPDTPTRE
ncbi:MAG: lysophospholipid acyltransferase family protein [Methanoregulaceae archaeon]|nr:lysophospholipid acyltransferase family protein [Methanoregulaceae archaeon]